MTVLTTPHYQFDDFELQPTRRTLLRSGEKVALAPKTFEVLLCLVQNAGRVVLKEDIFKAVWPNSFIEESNLTQHIFWLRKALADKSGYIVTIPGRGYEFTGTVQIVAEPERPLEPTVQAAAFGFRVQTTLERTHTVFEESVAIAPVVQPISRLRLALGVAAALLVAAVLASWGVWRSHHRHAAGDHHAVVLADFVNNTGDKTFDRILTQALHIDLEQSPYMDVLSEREAVNTLTMMGRSGDAPMTPAVAKEVCQRTNRQVLLTGAITAVGSQYLLTLEATDCKTDAWLTGAKNIATSQTRVLSGLDTLAEQVRAGLGESKKSVESYEVPLVQATTPSIEALRAYSIGFSLTAQGRDNSEVIPFYQRAIELDPQFAMAYSALGTRYYTGSEQKLANENFAKALALSNRVSARERMIIESHYYSEGMIDIQRGIKNYQMWSATYPHDYDPWHALGNMYFQLGQYGPGIDASRHALEAAPDRIGASAMLIWNYLRANRFDEAKATAALAAQRGKDNDGTHWPLYFMAWREQDQAALARETKWAEAHSEGWYGWWFPWQVAVSNALLGKLKLADGYYAKSYQNAEHLGSPQSADSVLELQAEYQIDFGLLQAARATVDRIRPQYADEPTLVILEARLGNLDPAIRYLAVHGDDHISDFHTYVNLPQVKAVVAMAQNRPLDAVAALESVRPYELCDYATIAFRARAYMQAGQPQMAIYEYKKILANPGIDAIEAPYALYHLGLARAYAAAGDHAASRAEYQTVVDAWKDADADAPLVQQARAEFARLP